MLDSNFAMQPSKFMQMNAKFEILVNQWITAVFYFFTSISKLRHLLQVKECRLIFVNMLYTNYTLDIKDII